MGFREMTAGRWITLLLFAATAGVSCSTAPTERPPTSQDRMVSTRGSIEVTAQLVEIPDGAIFQRDLYNYATVLKYQVVRVHRGNIIAGSTIYVGHYNPFLPRTDASDRRVTDIGGDLIKFQAGQYHRMALESSIDDHYMGGIVNKYFGQTAEPIHWAVWTNLAPNDTGASSTSPLDRILLAHGL